MNRFAKKLMTGMVTTGLLAGTLAVPAFAETAETTISVSGVVSGDTAAYYQILQQNSTTGAWELTDAVKAVTVEGAALTADMIADGLTNAELQAITGALTGAGTDMTASGTTLTADVTPGTYVVIITPGAANSGVVYNPVVVSADYDPDNGTNAVAISEAKKTDVTVQKTADDAKKDVNVGDRIDFTIDPVIPLFPQNYTAPVYKVSDSLKGGLEIVDSDGDGDYADEITVTGANAGDYEVKEATQTGFTVEFSSAYLKALTAVPDVTVTYTAEVKSAATYSVNRMTNTATVNFSNSPSDTTGHGSAEDETNHYTFTIDGDLGGEYTTEEKIVNKELVKTAVDTAGNPILDETTSYTYAGTTTKVSPLAGATFTLTGGTLTEAKTMTTGVDGCISFSGLDEGTYTLKETSAPSGYVVDPAEHTIVIQASYTQGTDELESYSITVDGKTTSSFNVVNTGDDVTITKEGTTVRTSLINNVKANGLPSTGGTGTTMFYVIGIILAVGAAVLLVTKRRMSAK